MNDYLNLLLSYPHPQSILLIGLLGIMRIAPIVVLAPFFGAKLLPGPVKMGLIVSITAVFLPHLVLLAKEPLHFDLSFIALCLKEIIIGMFLGFLVAIPFYIGSSAGTLIDHQRGSSSLMQTDPTLQVQSSPIGQLYNLVLIFIFFMLGGPAYYFDSVTLSFNIIPPDRWISPAFFLDLDLPIWQHFIDLANQVMTIAAQLAAPALVAILMSDLFLGIANRMATQVPMAFLGWALKSLVGLGILYVSWMFILSQLEVQTIKWVKLINHDIESLAVGQPRSLPASNN